MLFNVNFQIHTDEETQSKLEANMGAYTKRRFAQNFKAFSTLFPSLSELVGAYILKQYAPFVTRTKHLNVSNNYKGRALYHVNPSLHVEQQVTSFSKQALQAQRQLSQTPNPTFDPAPGAKLDSYFPGLSDNYQPLSETCDSLIVLGCGLGLHIDKLLSLKPWKRLLIVEPSLELLHISLYSANWMSVLRYASQNGCEVAMVGGVEGRESFSHIDEWVQQHQLVECCLQRHYSYSEFNQLELAVAKGEVGLASFSSFAPKAISRDRQYECTLPLINWYSKSETSSQSVIEEALVSSRFQRNFAALEKRFPDIAEAFKNYELSQWKLFSMPDGELNLFHAVSGDVLFQRSPKGESEQFFEHYLKSPRIETLDARYILRKPSPFLHYKYSDELRALVQKLPSDSRQLPEKIPSFIMYGCGLGYQVSQLLLQHKVDNFILYEPSWDFFYASLFTIDWAEILRVADEEERHIYLNIGDDGSNMFNDIHLRMHVQGINILSYTFFFTSYFDEELDKSIRATREQFQILTNIMEYYDHSLFNITHTNHLLKQSSTHVLLKDKPEDITEELAETPVFVIGNGPSLDSCVEVIKENRDKAILVSCGTSLKALYELGIQPDFHAEVEQTNATTLWISQVPDKQWLKQISLLSVCGVHPNVAAMFKDCFLGMKLGEASTVAYGRMDESFAEYQGILYSYPTVSNCAISSLLKLGFKQLYLFGVDLGFKDLAKHHSVHSAYYKKDGEQLYDYGRHGIGFRVKGNFESEVYTKHEFKFSAEIIATSLAEFPRVECYNTSDGAYIEGTMPLQPDSVLLLNNALDKTGFKHRLASKAYRRELGSCVEDFEGFYRKDNFIDSFEPIRALWDEPCISWEQTLEMMAEQGRLFKKASEDPHSLLYFLLRGSGAFCLTYMTRLAFSDEDEALCMSRLAEAIEVWKNYLDDAKDFYLEHYGEFDQTAAPLAGASFSD
ncbi:6-hydroxymethylpterin diphosphokinase MptE-like protein [Agarivorans sp. JK6]|uniref:motility associated factor glycosyltransferase family protein n=1 Tax=Agarivorans sp. JK6 TaxID=2997426 RepID=UPI00387317C7